MNAVTIRHAMAEDLPFCHNLAFRLAEVARLPWREQAEVDDFQRRYMRSALKIPPAAGSAIFLATEQNGEQLGFLHVEPAPDSITGEPCGYVSLLAVAEGAEGRGVAQALMLAAERWARSSGWRFLSLDDFANNERGRTFYERQGFRPETLRLYKPVA